MLERDVVFKRSPSMAEPKAINSFEVCNKTDWLNDILRLNVTAILLSNWRHPNFSNRRWSNNAALINTDKGNGFGFKIDAQYLVIDNLTVTAEYSFNHTEIQDDSWTVLPCCVNPDFNFTGNCNLLDCCTDGFAILIDRNLFPQAPESVFNFTARYSFTEGQSGEILIYTN